MDWFNYYGLAIMAIIMIPNIVYAVKQKNGFENNYHNKAVEILEQVSRYACFALMIFNIPYTYIGCYFSFGEAVYIIVNAVLVFAYCLSFIILWKKSGIVKALLLSIIPSLIFFFSSIMIVSVPLFVFSVIFAVTHILISVKNVQIEKPVVAIKKKIVITVTALFLTISLIAVSVFGGIIGYQQSSLGNLERMSVSEMIKYDCKDNGAKISVAVIENGDITYHIYGAGGEENALYDYEIGSISKTFVGLLCAKAVEEGKLNMSDSIAKYLDFDNEKYYPTIERLLTHTSGYRAYYFDNQMTFNKFAHITNDFYGISKEKILKKAKDVSLENKDYPFVYSNFGISVMGLILEKIYNDSFTNIMNNYISNELSLKSTQVAKQSGNLDNYWKWKETDGYIPAGSIVSNIKDMASYLNLYMTDSVDYAEDSYIKIKDIDANNAVYERMNIRMDGVGMTWMIDDKNDIVWHNGATTNFNSYIGFTKDKRKGVVILSDLSPNDKISMTVIGAKLLTTQETLVNSF